MGSDVVRLALVAARRALDGVAAPGGVLGQQAEALRGARSAIDEAFVVLVASARSSGASWEEVGRLLGTTGQAAQQRFGARPGVRGGRVEGRRPGYVSSAERVAARRVERVRVEAARVAYCRYLGARWGAAVTATGGRLLTELGARRRVNARRMLDGWRWPGAPVHASPELVAWLVEAGPVTPWPVWRDGWDWTC